MAAYAALTVVRNLPTSVLRRLLSPDSDRAAVEDLRPDAGTGFGGAAVPRSAMLPATHLRAFRPPPAARCDAISWGRGTLLLPPPVAIARGDRRTS